MAFMENKRDELVYMSSSLIRAHHAFTTRYGGVSKEGFSSLNLGSNRGDEPEAVRENYRRVCALMGADIDGCVVTRQVHGNVVRVVDERDKHACFASVPYEADGLVTKVRNLPIFCFVADCVPALLCDDKNGVAAAIHCGWRSSVADILKEAVEKMCALGAEREEICVAMGAAIGPCCFETDEDVPRAIDAYIGADAQGCYTCRPDGKYLIDLREANRRRLLQLGLKAENIDISQECTMCSHEKYWSHRYTKGQRGSQAAAIVLR